MHKHLSTFIVIIANSISIIAFAMEKKTERTFPKPLSRELSSAEQEAQIDNFKIISAALHVKFGLSNDNSSNIVPKEFKYIPENIDALKRKNEDLARVHEKIRDSYAQFNKRSQEITSRNNKKNTEKYADLDELIASLDVSTPPSQNQHTEQVTFEVSKIDLVSMLQDIKRKFLEVSQSAETFSSNDPKINPDFTFQLEELDKLANGLVPYLKLKSEEEKIPALTGLKTLVASTLELNAKIKQNNNKITRMTAYRAYSASLESLQETLELAK